MASDRTVYHVAPNASGTRWVVTQENGSLHEEVSSKAAAEAFAEARARGQEPSQVKVHKSDGNMEYESTHGEDPARSVSDGPTDGPAKTAGRRTPKRRGADRRDQ